MNICETYKEKFLYNQDVDSDFDLVNVNEDIFVGEDSERNLCVIIMSKEKTREELSYRTKLLSLQCNVSLTLKLNNGPHNDIYHVITCYSNVDNEKYLFLQLVDTYFFNQSITMDRMITIFGVLNDFFSKTPSLSANDLQGVYTELFTIYYFRNEFDFAKYWQSTDRMKFDFSITEDLKIDVKSTIKSERIHKFRHDQLNSAKNKVYIISYKLQKDDQGLSLYDLMKSCLPLLNSYPTKKARIVRYICDDECKEELQKIRFNENYTIDNMRIINALNIPKFKENPLNVTDAEYNSNCEEGSMEDNDYIIGELKEAIANK